MNFGALPERLHHVRAEIARQQAAGGWTHPVTIVAVTKGFGADAVAAALAAGLTDIGENRVQEALDKMARPEAAGAAWHLIGHLQRNKAKRAVRLFEWIHSLDSPEIAGEVSRRAADLKKRLACLVEVNTSGDETKFGVHPEGALSLLRGVTDLGAIEIRGLMTLGPLTGGAEGARRAFRDLASIRKDAARAGLLREDADLSMGMSDDFEIAIEEGATIVRLGVALFGGRPR